MLIFVFLTGEEYMNPLWSVAAHHMDLKGPGSLNGFLTSRY